MEKMVSGEGEAGHQPFAFIVPAQAAVTSDEPIVVEDINAAKISRDPAQLTIDPTQEARLASFGLAVEHSAARMNGRRERVHDERGLAVLTESGDRLLDAAHDAFDSLLRDVGRQISEVTGKVGRGFFGADGEHHGRGRKVVEGTVRVD